MHPYFWCFFSLLLGKEMAIPAIRFVPLPSSKATEIVPPSTVFKRKRHIKTTSWMLDFRLRHGSFLLILCSSWTREFTTKSCDCWISKLKIVYVLKGDVGYCGYIWSCYIPNTMKDEMYIIWRRQQYRSFIITPYHEEVSSPFNWNIWIVLNNQPSLTS